MPFAGAQEAGTGPDEAAWPAGADADPVWAALARARDGDRDAFAFLYDRYVDHVYRFVYWRVGHDQALAEDLTSETFVRALRAIRSFTYRGRDPGGWFLTIARNLLLDHVKSARSRLEVPTGEVQESPGSAGAGRAEAASGRAVPRTPEEEVLSALTIAEMMRALPEDQQECVRLRLLEDRSVEETAELMGKSKGAVKALQHRAVKRLGQRIGGRQ